MVDVEGTTALRRRCLRRPSRALPAPEVREWETGWPGGQGKKKSVTFDCGEVHLQCSLVCLGGAPGKL